MLPYEKEDIAVELGEKAVNVQNLKGVCRISYMTESQLQQMKWRDLSIPVCEGVQQPVLCAGWSRLSKKVQHRKF